MELLALGLFCGLLLICLILKISIIIPLAAGLIIFLIYGKKKGFDSRQLAQMSFEGVKRVHNILLVFLLIGIMTSLWRDAGTIPTIVCFAAGLIRPSVFLLLAFLFNCAVSFLTGTSFGTAATMGIICTTIGSVLGVDPLLTGGAVLSGAFFGDRCSPVSTSALLVAELTQTNIFTNIKNMMRSAAVPFLLCCLLYGILGAATEHSGTLPDLPAIFGRGFVLHWTAVLPAAVILLLSALRIKVKLAMVISIITAIPISVFLQGTPFSKLPELMLFGYFAPDAQIAAMMNGGGILSMLEVAAIVCISSAYSGIFRRTGLLDKCKDAIDRLAKKTTPILAMACTSALSGLIACNQTLTIMLTDQLTHELIPNKEKLALNIEDTAVVISALIPWSIAGAVPIAAMGSTTGCLPFAFYLYLIPLWRIAVSLIKKHKK